MTKIVILTGEPSGDFLGARLMAALQKRDPTIQFSGVGGQRMLNAGLQPYFPQRDLALFGLFELLPKIPLLIKRLRQTVTTIKANKPDVVITIDSPDFVFRVGKRLQGSGIKIVHYVAPSVWAWRPGRAKKVAQFLTHLLTLFPFEPPYFTKEGLPTTFVGHPLIENHIPGIDAHDFRLEHNIPIDAPLLIVLPGSRRSEVTKLLPIFHETVKRLQIILPNLQIVVPTVPHVAAFVRSALANWNIPHAIVDSEIEKYKAFKSGQATLCASGTVTLECALANLPMVVAYRISKLTELLYKRLFITKYFSLVNILLNREAVPELLQDDCTPEKLSAVLLPLLTQQDARIEQQQDLSLILPMLQNGDRMPSELAADVIWKTIQESRSGNAA